MIINRPDIEIECFKFELSNPSYNSDSCHRPLFSPSITCLCEHKENIRYHSIMPLSSPGLIILIQTNSRDGHVRWPRQSIPVIGLPRQRVGY